jgi:hypothetical protein
LPSHLDSQLRRLQAADTLTNGIVKRPAGLAVLLVTLLIAVFATATVQAARPPIKLASVGGTLVTLTVTVRVPLICGRLHGPLSIPLTTGITPPASIRPAGVLINRSPAGRVSVSGRDVTVSPAAQSGVTCQTIALGKVVVVFSRQTGIRSSRTAGTYPIVVHRGPGVFRGLLTIAP